MKNVQGLLITLNAFAESVRERRGTAGISSEDYGYECACGEIAEDLEKILSIAKETLDDDIPVLDPLGTIEMNQTTVNGKDPKELTKEEAIAFCYANRDEFIQTQHDSLSEGVRQFSCLIEILNGTIEPHEIVDYGMSDQEFE